MIKDNEFTELCLFIDSREQTNAKDGNTRVKRVMDWFLNHGGAVDMIEIRALPLCDIVICGGFDTETKTFLPGVLRGKTICVGIEYKQMVDYSNSHPDLEWKLIDAYLHFKQVALFVEEGDMELSYVNGNTFIRNKAVVNGTADILAYEHYKNNLDRYSRIADIHVRTFPYETFIDANLDSLLVMIAGEPKAPMYCKGKDLDVEKVAFINSLLYIPKIGVATAMKFTDYYPNWEIMAEHASYTGEYESIAGILTGKRVREFVQMGREKNKKICSRVNECFENRKSLTIIVPEEPHIKPISKEEIKEMANAIVAYVACYPDGREAEQICKHFNCEDNSEEKESLLKCIKKLAWAGRLTSTRQGIFIVSKNIEASQSLDVKAITPDLTSIDSSRESKDSATFTSQNINENAKTDKINSLSVLDTSGIAQKIAVSKITCTLDAVNLDTSVLTSQSSVLIQKENKTANDGTYATCDALQSPQIISTPPILCGDKAGESIPSSATFIPKPIIQSLEDVIIDICFEKPKADFSILSACQARGHQVPEIHAALIKLCKTKFKKFNQNGMTMYSYYGENGVRAMPEYDVLTGELI